MPMTAEDDYSKVLGKSKAKKSKPKSEEDDVLEVGENGVDISS